jgi:hypothetical protein
MISRPRHDCNFDLKTVYIHYMSLCLLSISTLDFTHLNLLIFHLPPLADF